MKVQEKKNLTGATTNAAANGATLITNNNPLPNFSKVADMKIPDSPPPEKAESENQLPGAEPGMGKFEQLMKAAVSIKTAQLDQKKKKFEKLPTFLKAGLYFTNKLECVRQQTDFYCKLFAFEIIRDEGTKEFHAKNYDRACRKFEEALSIFRYHICYNPKWQEQGVDDDEIKEFDEQGKTDFEKSELRRLKLALYLNIAACNIKTKDFETAVAACIEALKLDPYNVKALYRRARAVALPINAGVEDFRTAIVDLKRIVEVDPSHAPAQRELRRLQNLVDVNRKREKDTYGKMFQGSNQDGSRKSITDYLEERKAKEKQVPINYKTMEDMEYEQERAKMEERVKEQMRQKVKDFSFEVLPEEKRRHFPEMIDLNEMIEKAEESYKIFRRTGRGKEAKVVKQKLEEALFAKEHLFHVMNLDFSKPTPKLINMARQNHIDLTDPQVIEEFRRIQQQNLEDIRRMKEGKRPLTDEEMKAKLQAMRDQEHADARRKLEEVQRKKEESVRNLVENALKAQDQASKIITQDEQKIKNEQFKHYLALGAFMIVWLGFIFYQNYELQQQASLNKA